MRVSDVEHADAADEVDVFLAVDIPEARALGALDEDRVGVADAARDLRSPQF
jgi:hypothetical protein